MKRLGLLSLVFLLLAACTTPQEPTSPIPDAAASNIEASKTATDLGKAVKVTVTLKSAEGETVSRSQLPVAFYADGGTLGSAGKVATITPTAAGSMVIEPNAEGTASVFINSDVDGVVTVTAYLGSDDSGQQIGQIQVTFGAGDVKPSDPDDEEPAEEQTPSAADSTINASRLKTATGASEVVTVQLHDATGEPLALAGAKVTFTTDAGSLSADGESFGGQGEPLAALTDANGTASAHVTSAVDGTVAVTAYLYADASAPVIGSVAITFASVALNDLTVTYDGQAHGLVAAFSDEAAAVDAVYTYVRESDEQVFTTAPVDAGVYAVTVEAGGGFPGSAAATLTIETREIRFDGEVVFSSKEYDGASTAPAVAALKPDDIVPGDDVALATPIIGEFQTHVSDEWVASSQVGAYPNDGSARVVGMFTLIGDDANNYFITQPTGAAAIEVREIAFASGVTVEGKEYDGTVAAAVTGDLDPAPLAGEEVTFVGQFASPNAGADVAVTVTLTGADAHKYSLAPTALTADITPRPLTITAGDRSKLYGDALELGTADFSVEGLLEGEGIDSVTLTSAGASEEAFAGDFAVTPSAAEATEGTLLANYAVTYVPGTLSVSPRDLTIAPDPGQGKTYGDAEPSLTYTSTGLVNGDSLTGSLARAAGEAAGQYDFDLGSLAIMDGNEGGNYVLAIAAGAAQFQVSPRELVVTAGSDQSKTYGEFDPVLSYTLTEGSLVDGDAFTGALGRELGEDVGAYAFTLGDLSVVDGNEGGNYVIALEASDSFVIGVRTVTVGGSMVPADRPYDGTTEAQLAVNELVLVNAVEGDDVAILPVVTFADRHVEEGKLVTLTEATSLGGEDAGNYVLDLTGAPTATGRIAKAPIAFDITNKDSLTYTGSALGLVTVTDPAPAPDTEPVAYNLQYRRIATSAGDVIDEGVGAILKAGQYRVTVTSSDPRYVGSDEIIVTVGARPITLTSNVTSKVYGEADPELPPLLADGTTLGSGDSLTGLLGFSGSDAGTYELSLGTVALMNAGKDVTGNYAITVAGTFTVQPAPVTFDITNFDFSVEGVHVFERDGSSIVGFVVASDPEGMTDYALSYRRTHDAEFEPIPGARQAVSAVRALGTYVVTIESTNGNYIGSSDRVVWLTDALDLSGWLPDGGEEGEPFSVPLPIGELGRASIPFVTADGEYRSLGPVPITFELNVEPTSGLKFLDPETGDPVTSVTVAPGEGAIDFDVQVTALSTVPYTVTISPTGPLASLIGGVTFQVIAEAQLHIIEGEVAVGEDANSSVVSVQLRDSKGAPVEAPADVTLSLVGDEGLVFVSATTDEVIEGVVIPSGSTSANFRVRSTAAGQYAFYAGNDSAVLGIHQSDAQSVTVNPKPTLTSVDPATIEIGQTTQLTIDGADFAPGAMVLIGGLVVSDVAVESPTRITVTAAAPFGDVDASQVSVEVTNPDGGSGVLVAGLDVVKPTLNATDDVLNLVEGGSLDLSKSTLLTNDAASTGLSFSLVGLGNFENVSVVDNGATLRVTSTGLMDQGASFVYTIEDVLGTQAIGTVTFNMTLPPQDAVVFTERADLEAYTAGYAPPTVQEVFNTWPRASNNNYFANPSSATGSASRWSYDAVNDRFVQPDNTSTHEVIVSPPDEGLEYYTFEATLTSSDTDDDSIGLVIAFVNDGDSLKYLVAHRTQGGNDPRAGWGITYFENGVPKRVLTNVSVGTVSNAWSGKQSRIRIVRNGDVATATATPWNDLTNFQAPMVIDFNANTINGAAVPADVDLSVFKGERQYGYYTLSQEQSTYLDVTVTGGLARDLAYLLTGGADTDDVPGDDTWSGSEVWKFNAETLVWQEQSGRTIHGDLRYPRIVTSVAPVDPADPDSAEIGTRFEINESVVVLLTEQP